LDRFVEPVEFVGTRPSRLNRVDQVFVHRPVEDALDESTGKRAKGAIAPDGGGV
jgi:hypothetical protein